MDGINKTAQSWAVGGTGTRPGEDTNNAKYWAQQAQTAVGGDFATKEDAQGYVTAHNESVDAHPDLRVAVAGSVRYDASQSLTDEQKAQARTNINAAPGGFGLGGAAKMLTEADNVDNIKASGWYTWSWDPAKQPAGLPKEAKYHTGLLRVDSANPATYDIVQTIYIIYSPPTPNHGDQCVIQRMGLTASDVWNPFEWINPPMELGTEYRTTERYLGKPVYVKAVDCGQIADGKEVAHGIDNMLYCIFAQGLRGGMPMPVIFNHNLSDPWSCYISQVTATKIRFECGTSAAGGNCAVLFKYIKTTD